MALETISDKGSGRWGLELERALEFAKEMSDRAREVFEAEGSVDPVSFLIMQVNPETGEPFEGKTQQVAICSPKQFGIQEFDGVGRSMYTDLLRALAEKTKATGVVMIQEIWIWKGSEEERPPSGSLEFVPGRREAVSMIFEHQQLGNKSMMWLAEITRLEGGKGVLGEFNEMPSDRAVQASGRFVGIIPNKRAFEC